MINSRIVQIDAFFIRFIPGSFVNWFECLLKLSSHSFRGAPAKLASSACPRASTSSTSTARLAILAILSEVYLPAGSRPWRPVRIAIPKRWLINCSRHLILLNSDRSKLPTNHEKNWNCIFCLNGLRVFWKFSLFNFKTRAGEQPPIQSEHFVVQKFQFIVSLEIRPLLACMICTPR